MIAKETWKNLGWRHEVWDLLRFYHSLRAPSERKNWLIELETNHSMDVDRTHHLPINPQSVSLLVEYLPGRQTELDRAFSLLRTEAEAMSYCKVLKCAIGKTTTQNIGHHQSSKALVASVSTIAGKICKKKRLTLVSDPQRRCVWCTDQGFHVSARNLDGAIPTLINPSVVWEIKEYWGKTSGGSKMSDAVYECQLVGRELREFEEKSGMRIAHVVFLDGRDQWTSRKSDLMRFIDLLNQGLIDCLFIGKEVETLWAPTLQLLLDTHP